MQEQPKASFITHAERRECTDPHHDTCNHYRCVCAVWAHIDEVRRCAGADALGGRHIAVVNVSGVRIGDGRTITIEGEDDAMAELLRQAPSVAVHHIVGYPAGCYVELDASKWPEREAITAALLAADFHDVRVEGAEVTALMRPRVLEAQVVLRGERRRLQQQSLDVKLAAGRLRSETRPRWIGETLPPATLRCVHCDADLGPILGGHLAGEVSVLCRCGAGMLLEPTGLAPVTDPHAAITRDLIHVGAEP